MEDELGRDGRFRPCLHETSSWSFDAPVVNLYNYCSFGGNSYAFEVGNSHLINCLAIQTAPDADLNELAAEAAAFMVPRLNEGTSLVNFLIELKDFKRMVSPQQFLLKRHYALRELANPVSRRAFIRELTQKLTGAHLNASFGLVPFVRDIVEMHDELASLAYRLKRLKQFAGMRQQRHYRRYLPDDLGNKTHRVRVGSIVSDTWGDPWRGDGAFVVPQRPSLSIRRWSRWVRRPVYHATMRYSYTLPSMTEAEEKVAVHLDALGIRLDPAIIWNAIPFSFLVDWVVDVSGFLRSFARDNFPINTTILDFCHSLTYSKECGVSCILADRATLSPRPQSRSGTIEACVARNYTTYYNRMLTLPSLHTVLTRGFTLRKAALSGSLLLNNSRRAYQRIGA